MYKYWDILDIVIFKLILKIQRVYSMVSYPKNKSSTYLETKLKLYQFIDLFLNIISIHN